MIERIKKFSYYAQVRVAVISITCMLSSARSGHTNMRRRTFAFPRFAEIAQLVEHHHGKVRVVGSIPTLGSLF